MWNCFSSWYANAQVLAEPIFTPAAKAEMGQHDENISYAEVEKRIGSELAKKMRETSIRLYREAAQYALEKGIIIADTKFEFGLDENNSLVLMDEVLTADSSRFWPAASYQGKDLQQRPPNKAAAVEMMLQ
jgi:phosphoribosylaminoimidazole-succinocarboxamide synthase